MKTGRGKKCENRKSTRRTGHVKRERQYITINMEYRISFDISNNQDYSDQRKDRGGYLYIPNVQ